MGKSVLPPLPKVRRLSSSTLNVPGRVPPPPPRPPAPEPATSVRQETNEPRLPPPPSLRTARALPAAEPEPDEPGRAAAFARSPSSSSVSFRELSSSVAPVEQSPEQRSNAAAVEAVAGGKKRGWRMPQPYQLIRRMIPGRLLFEAHDHDTGRRVAVQLLKGVRDEQTLVERYAAVARLSHAQTVRLLDAGVVLQPIPVGYLVRELVPGETLCERLARERVLPVSVGLQLALGILASLEEAHDLGLSHGRLSAEHVLLGRGESASQAVKVLGYWPPSVPRTECSPCGAPEQRADGVATPAADVFSVGALLYRAVTGRFPAFEALHEGQALKLPAAAEPLRECLSKTLLWSPQERYADAGAMRQALLRLCVARSWAASWGNESWAASGGNESSAASGGNESSAAGWGNESSAAGWGNEATGAAAVMRPVRDELMAARPVTLWVLEDDPVVRHPELALAFEKFGRQHQVRFVGAAEHPCLLEQLVQARLSPPWVLLYGPQSLRGSAALLRLLSQSAEVSRVLLCDPNELDVLKRAIDLGGVEQHLPFPCLAAEVEEVFERAVRRTRRCSAFYDAIRGRLMRSREGLIDLSRELTALPQG